MTEQLPPVGDLPCPPWCGLRPGHDFLGYDGGLLVRFHEQHFGPRVSVQQIENAIGTGGPVIEYGRPFINLLMAEELTSAADAREAAGALTAAAVLLEQLPGPL